MAAFHRAPPRATPIALLLLSAGGAPTWAQNPGFGPLTAEEGAPLERLSYTPATEGAAPVARGRMRMDVWLGYANYFEQDSTAEHQLFLDAERLLTTTTLRYGVAEGWEMGAHLTLETTGGGVFDRPLEAFHRALGLGNNRRPLYARNAYRQELIGADGRVLVDFPKRTLTPVDARLFAKWRAYGSRSGRALLSLRGVVRIPTASNIVGQERTDFSLMALGRVPWGSRWVHAMAGVTTVRASPELEGVMAGSAWFGSLATELPMSPRTSFVAQLEGTTSRLKGFHAYPVDGNPADLILGLVGRAASDWRWEVSLQEDLPPKGPAIDFTLGLGLSRTW